MLRAFLLSLCLIAIAVADPKPVKRIEPAYPIAAGQTGVHGEVTMTGMVKADGTVGDMRIVS